jgi:L-amino acid N-acyltransferase YncA
MDYPMRPAADGDAQAVADIFNQFVKNSFAAYPSVPVDASFLSRLKTLAGRLPIYVIESPKGEVVGFVGLRPLHMANSMARSAEATIFILPEHTHCGVASAAMKLLEQEARVLGVDTIIGGASSHNETSLQFQRRHGFVECGRFRRVGRKFDQDFDIVWMQKFL